ncbi:MAG: Pr6Pr family membrane protein, partial [Patescibacteria group bacterium]
LSNVFVTVVFVMSAYYLAIGKKPSVADDVLRGASVLYMAITGIVYALLLSGIDVDLSLPWVNLQLHYIMPIVVVADWLYQPQRGQLTIKKIAPWLIFPTLYLIYNLVRGPLVGWYPYPFLDPNTVGGYGGVVLYSIGIVVALCAVSFVLMKLGNLLKRHVA